MLKNIAISTDILKSFGFSIVPVEKGVRQTILKRGDTTAEVLSNGAVVINGNKTDFKAVKKKKIAGI